MAEPQAPGRKTNVFTRKIGPLPMWAWTAIVAVIVIGWAVLAGRNKKAAAATSSGVDASQVPEFVNQTSVMVVPPAAPGRPHPGVPTDNDKDDRKRKPREDHDEDDERRRRKPRGRQRHVPPGRIQPGGPGSHPRQPGPVHPRRTDVA